jgi:formylglycine-generating enzyme
MLRLDVGVLLLGASVLSCGGSGASGATGGSPGAGGSQSSGGQSGSGGASGGQSGGAPSGGTSSGGKGPGSGGASSGGAIGTGGATGGGSSGGSVSTGDEPPSCAPGGPGLTTCGPDDESCCTSLLVTGGTFFRSYTNGGGGPSGTSAAATLSDFRLDKYEVTTARFRQFVTYLVEGGAPPAAGSGKHTHLNGGQGLQRGSTAGSYEPGWNADWNDLLSDDIADWTQVLASGEDASLYGTFTEAPGENDELPITFPSWYEAHAFCIWDGGFLPSEAEWKYAAAGGDEQRRYPWGSDSPSSDNQHLIYDCCFPSGQCSASSGFDTCTGLTNIAPVGSTPLGVGRYGQFDLSGNVWEWNLDAYSAQYDSPCTDCAHFDGNERVMPGGGFHSGMTYQYSYNRQAVNWNPDTYRGDYAVGVRCARAP